MRGGLKVVVVGIDSEPTRAFMEDIERLKYEVVLATWSESTIDVGERPVIATVIDFRALGVHAEQACRAVRQHRVLRKSPIIALIFEQEGPRLDLSIDVDDLILSPYRLSELAARLRLARWRLESKSSPEVLRAGGIALNPITYEVFVDRVPAELTLKEYQLLLFLMRSPGRVFTREELLDHVWGSDYYGGTRTVDVHIRRLRAKTERAGAFIETVRGVGYRFVPPAPEAV